jgi:hypothetical protein
MSVTLYIVAEREIPGLDVFVSGKALGHSEHVDLLAEAAGVKSLMEFYSQDPMDAELFPEDKAIEPPEGGFPPPEWYSADDGLRTVWGLLSYLNEHPYAVPDVPALIEDLREFDSVLSRLASEGVRWHLAVDY